VARRRRLGKFSARGACNRRTAARSTRTLELMRISILALHLLLPVAALADGEAEFLATLKKTRGDYQWNATRVVSVDIDRDGAVDRAALGLRTDTVALLLQLGGNKEPLVTEIPIDAGKQFGICAGDDRQISVHQQSDRPQNALGENPPGYEQCPECFEIEIGGGDCDPIQFYWDVAANQLSWWRA
jgi:hypothetical protein